MIDQRDANEIGGGFLKSEEGLLDWKKVLVHRKGFLMHQKGFLMHRKGFLMHWKGFLMHRKRSNEIGRGKLKSKEGFYALEGVQLHQRGIL